MTPSDAARALSKLGASKGGKARAKVLTEARRVEIAIKASRAAARKRKAKKVLDTLPE